MTLVFYLAWYDTSSNLIFFYRQTISDQTDEEYFSIKRSRLFLSLLIEDLSFLLSKQSCYFLVYL